MIDVNMSVFISVWLGVCFGLPVAMIILKYLQRLIKKPKETYKIVEYSNVIQFDEMGYPLRLVIGNDGEQIWIDTTEREDDVVLVWTR